jgi:type I restriction enzyme, S subunit
MTELRCVKFGDMAHQITTKVNPKDTSLETYVGLEHLDSNSLQINRHGTPKDVIGEKLRVCKGDIIFGKRRVYQRKLAIADFDGICSAHAMVLRPKVDVVDKEFFPFFMQSDRFMERALQISVGSLSPTINWKTLADQEFTIPSLSNQSGFTTIFQAAEDCIVKGERFVGAAEWAKQVLMGELFSKGIGNHKITKVAGIGSIPCDWTILKMGSFSKITTGGTPNRKVKIYWHGDIPWIKTGEINYRTIYRTDEKITKEGLKNSSARIIPARTLLMALYGEGVTRARVTITGIDAAINQACAAIFPEKNVSTQFLYYYLSSQYSTLRNLGGGANQKNLNISIIKNVPIPIPALPEQHLIVGILTRCDETIAAARANVVSAKALKMKMINQLLNPDYES